MSNLMCRKSIDRNLPDPTDGICESYGDRPRIGEVQEPIHVCVRVRQYGALAPDARPARAEKPDFGQLPIGSILDCYL
jgi:hypothetical protein